MNNKTFFLFVLILKGLFFSEPFCFGDASLLCSQALERREEIAAIKMRWKEKISQIEDPSFLEELDMLVKTGSLIPSEQGCGSAYFLLDQEGNTLYVVKPLDEDIFCLNNNKQFHSPFNNRAYRVRKDIPLYRSVNAEVLSYALAKALGLDHLTPTTHLAVIHHKAFFDITDPIPLSSPFCEQVGKADKEKFCSVQTYQQGAQTVYSLVEKWIEQGSTTDEILAALDSTNFEELILLIWLLFDTDAHAGNLYIKTDEVGKNFLFKIDNGLTFPDKNSHLVNALYFFPQAEYSFSQRLKKKIETLPIDTLKELFTLYEMESAQEAFLERVQVLQELVKDSKYSLREIDLRLHALELPNGRLLAVSDLSLKELHKLIVHQ